MSPVSLVPREESYQGREYLSIAGERADWNSESGNFVALLSLLQHLVERVIFVSQDHWDGLSHLVTMEVLAREERQVEISMLPE